MHSGPRIVAVVVAVVVGWLLVGPQHLGGPVAAVSTYGSSMLPTYDAQTLVLARRAPSYAVGDVIAYRSATLDGAVVLHRIVDEDADGFITQGDNNDWLDPDRPTADDILGRAWVAVPHLGRVLDLPTPLKVAIPLLLMTGVTMPTPTSRRRSRPDGPADPGARPAAAPAPRSRPGGRPSQLLVGSSIGLLLATTATVVAWSTPTTEPGPVTHEQTTAFAYAADVPASPVYPDGRVHTGDPIFLQVEDEVDVSADWSFTSDEPSSLAGTGQLVAIVTDGNGWEATEPLGPTTEWTGPTATLTGTLDLGELQRLASRAGDVTGMQASSLTVAVTADLAIEGTLAGAPLEATATPSLDLSVSPLRASVEGSGEDGDDLTVTEEGSITVAEAATSQLQLGGLAVDVPTARVGSLGFLGAAVVALAGALVAARRNRTRDVHDRIMAAHGDAILHVDALAPASHGTTAAVPDVDELVALAQLRGLPVMRVPLLAGGYAYVVDDLATRYHCLLPSPQHDVTDSEVTDRDPSSDAEDRTPVLV